MQITDSIGCKAFSASVYINVTAVKLISVNKDISIRPNPSNDGKFYLSTSNAIGNVEWKVFNVLGDIVAEATENKGSQTPTQLINISTQVAGIYYLELKLNSSVRTIKLLKQ